MFVSLGFVLLAQDTQAQVPVGVPAGDIPEREGDYPDPQNPGVRVRVFVYHPREHRSTAIALACTDPDSTAVVSPTGWKLPAGNWAYNLNPGSVPASVGLSSLATIADAGFEKWETAIASSPSRPVLVRGADTTKTKSAYDKINLLAWGQTSGTALAVTYIRYYTATGIVVDVDTIMNKRVPWSWTQNACGDPNSYDAQNIWTHEGGHWFGLNDHYNTPYIDNTMYGYGAKGETKKDTITTGDRLGIKSVYP